MNMHVAPAPAPHAGQSRDELQPTVVDRTTKSGRRLWYKLTVIQQPERARACGSGPKSSADRRPVDPPPVVELRIFEGNTWAEAEQKDITFLYNANFFLYATLEHARAMAHGRVQTQSVNQPPVLTGMPVSGMAYLDRPNEAGYFLFPDLSVRHEGRYRLTFNLYEETKEDKDKDPDTPDSSNLVAPGFSNAQGGSFDFRMEVKSDAFIVFSAKKFPGLAESTQLSRVVAEQGCRVRIRRDVRMRRRDRTKDGGDYDNVEDEYIRRKRTETPEVKPNYRPRSMSGSMERSSFSGESQRRQSGAEYPPQYPQTPASAGGHLQFLGNAPQYHPHAQSHSRPPSMPPSPSYHTSHGAQFPQVHPSPHQQLHQHNVHVQPPAPRTPQQPAHQAAYPPPPQQQQQNYNHSERPQPPAYARSLSQSTPTSEREMAPRDFAEPALPQYREPMHRERDFRDAPVASHGYTKEFMLPPMTQKPTSYPPPPPPQQQQQQPRTSIGLPTLTLPPLSDLVPRMGSLTSPTSDRVPPLQSMPPPKPVASLPPPPPPSVPPPSVAGYKRSRDDSRRYDVETPRYHNGAREDPQLLDNDGELPLIYKRANGNAVTVPYDQEPHP